MTPFSEGNGNQKQNNYGSKGNIIGEQQGHGGHQG